MKIRKCTKDDSQNLLDTIKAVESESNFMLYDKDERKTSKEDLEKFIIAGEMQGAPIFLAEADNEVCGYLLVDRGRALKKNHCVYIVLGVIQSKAGRGIGTKLIEELFSWAKDNNIVRIELTVMENNQRAIHLYKKMGFKIEGVKEKSIMMQGSFINEYYMAKIL